jgi:outer membrane protein TolC
MSSDRPRPLAAVFVAAHFTATTVALFGTAPAAAQGTGWTLPAAIEQAIAANEISGIAAARLEGAAALKRQAIAQLLPALTLSANATRRAREVTRTIEDDEVTVQARDAYSSAAVVETPLFDLRALPLLRAANHTVAAQTFESDELRRALAFDVADSFYAALSAEKVLAAALRRVEVAEQTVNDSSLRLDAGLANRNDLTRTQLELATARLAATSAGNLVTTTRLSLAYLIAAPVDGGLVAPEAEAALPGTREELVASALAGHQELAALAERTEEARQLALVPRYGWVPRLDFVGLYRWTNESGLSGRPEDWNLGANLTWEIFDSGERRAVAAQRDAITREAELVLSQRRREIELEVDRASADYATAQAALEQSAVQRDVAKQNFEEVDERYRNGLASALEQTDALVSAFEAEVGMVRQQFASAVARLALEEAIGSWPVPVEPLEADS